MAVADADTGATPGRSDIWLYAMLAVYVASAAAVSVQRGVFGHENTFDIYRASFSHLLAGRDLYAPDPARYRDLFKYSPTFALLFAPFAILPFPLALFLWNATNALALAAGIASVLPPRRAAIALALCFWEMTGALQYAQSNALVAGLMILTFVALERGRVRWGAAAAALGACIKIYPLAAIVCAVPLRRARSAIAWTVVALIVLVALPAAVLPGGAHALLAQYRSWRALEAVDALQGVVPAGQHVVGLNGGVMQLARVCCDVHWPNWTIQLAGTALLLLPLALRRRSWDDPRFRLAFLCSVLVYAVLFNHKAESPSYIVGMAGIAIWFAAGPLTRTRTAFALALLVTVSAPGTGLFSHQFYREFFMRYTLKTLPLLVVWLVMQTELLAVDPRRNPGSR
jgi:glycosyl transferase family 87